MDNLPFELCSLVLSYLDDEEKILLIKTYTHLRESFDKFSYLIPLDLRHLDIRKEDYKYIANAHTIKFPTSTEDDDLIYFKQSKIVNLQFCENITDNGLANLQDVTELYLFNNKITNDAIENCKKIQKISIRCCANIDSKILQYLSSCKYVRITKIKNISSEDFKYLSNVEDIVLNFCDIKKDCFKHLKNTKSIKIYNIQVENESLKYLSHIDEVSIYNSYTTNEGIAHLKSCKVLYLSLKNIDDECMIYLKNVEQIYLYDCPNIKKDYPNVKKISYQIWQRLNADNFMSKC